MKQFNYNLGTVLDYKIRVLDELKTEHAVIIEKVIHKQQEIILLKDKQKEMEKGFNQAKACGSIIENLRLYDLCIESMENIITMEQKALHSLEKQEMKKKDEVITARVDMSKFERLKEKQYKEHRKAKNREAERFTEEFVVNAMATARFQAYR